MFKTKKSKSAGTVSGDAKGDTAGVRHSPRNKLFKSFHKQAKHQELAKLPFIAPTTLDLNDDDIRQSLILPHLASKFDFLREEQLQLDRRSPLQEVTEPAREQDMQMDGLQSKESQTTSSVSQTFSSSSSIPQSSISDAYLSSYHFADDQGSPPPSPTSIDGPSQYTSLAQWRAQRNKHFSNSLFAGKARVDWKTEIRERRRHATESPVPENVSNEQQVAASSTAESSPLSKASEIEEQLEEGLCQAAPIAASTATGAQSIQKQGSHVQAVEYQTAVEAPYPSSSQPSKLQQTANIESTAAEETLVHHREYQAYPEHQETQQLSVLTTETQSSRYSRPPSPLIKLPPSLPLQGRDLYSELFWTLELYPIPYHPTKFRPRAKKNHGFSDAIPFDDENIIHRHPSITPYFANTPQARHSRQYRSRPKSIDPFSKWMDHTVTQYDGNEFTETDQNWFWMDFAGVGRSTEPMEEAAALRKKVLQDDDTPALPTFFPAGLKPKNPEQSRLDANARMNAMSNEERARLDAEFGRERTLGGQGAPFDLNSLAAALSADRRSVVPLQEIRLQATKADSEPAAQEQDAGKWLSEPRNDGEPRLRRRSKSFSGTETPWDGTGSESPSSTSNTPTHAPGLRHIPSAAEIAKRRRATTLTGKPEVSQKPSIRSKPSAEATSGSFAVTRSGSTKQRTKADHFQDPLQGKAYAQDMYQPSSRDDHAPFDGERHDRSHSGSSAAQTQNSFIPTRKAPTPGKPSSRARSGSGSAVASPFTEIDLPSNDRPQRPSAKVLGQHSSRLAKSASLRNRDISSPKLVGSSNTLNSSTNYHIGEALQEEEPHPPAEASSSFRRQFSKLRRHGSSGSVGSEEDAINVVTKKSSLAHLKETLSRGPSSRSSRESSGNNSAASNGVEDQDMAWADLRKSHSLKRQPGMNSRPESEKQGVDGMEGGHIPPSRGRTITASSSDSTTYSSLDGIGFGYRKSQGSRKSGSEASGGVYSTAASSDVDRRDEDDAPIPTMKKSLSLGENRKSGAKRSESFKRDQSPTRSSKRTASPQRSEVRVSNESDKPSKPSVFNLLGLTGSFRRKEGGRKSDAKVVRRTIIYTQSPIVTPYLSPASEQADVFNFSNEPSPSETITGQEYVTATRVTRQPSTKKKAVVGRGGMLRTESGNDLLKNSEDGMDSSRNNYEDGLKPNKSSEPTTPVTINSFTDSIYNYYDEDDVEHDEGNLLPLPTKDRLHPGSGDRRTMHGLEVREHSDGTVTWGIVESDGQRRSYISLEDQENVDQSDSDDESEEYEPITPISSQREPPRNQPLGLGIGYDNAQESQHDWSQPSEGYNRPNVPPPVPSRAPPPIPPRSPRRALPSQNPVKKAQLVSTKSSRRTGATTSIYYAPEVSLPTLLKQVYGNESNENNDTAQSQQWRDLDGGVIEGGTVEEKLDAVMKALGCT